MSSHTGTWIPEAAEPFPPIFARDSQSAPAVAPAAVSPVDAHQLLYDVLGGLRRQIDAKRLDVNLQLVARGYLIPGDRDRLQQTYRNLIANAISYAPRGGQLTVRSSCPTPEALRVGVTHCTKAAARAAAAATALAGSSRH